MRPSNAPRSIAIARRSNHVQPTAILGTIGMIAMLMAVWTGLVL